MLVYAAAASAATSERVNLDIGQSLNLETLDGPNVRLVISSVDSYNVSFMTMDYNRMIVTVSGGNGGSQPTTLRQQVPVAGNATLLFRRKGMSVFFVDSSMNHVTLSIVKD